LKHGLVDFYQQIPELTYV